MESNILLIAVGNPSRGDDALGPELIRRLERALDDQGSRGEVELLTDFQLQIEHALDLRGRDLVIFADADQGEGADLRFERIHPARECAFTTHALSPQAVLATYHQIEGRTPPPSYLLAIPGASFELGEPLSVQAERYLEQALRWLLELVRQPSEAYWDCCCGTLAHRRPHG